MNSVSNNSSQNDVKIIIKYMTSLRHQVGHNQQQVTFKIGSTLEDVADWLSSNYGLSLPNSQIITVLNGRGWMQHSMKMQTQIKENDVICLIPPISGG